MIKGEYTLEADRQKEGFWKFILKEMKPRGKIFTPFNIISLPIMLTGLVLIVIRFWKGIGSFRSC